MRTALVADTFSVEKGTGIARYSREMLRGLRQQGLRVEPIAPVPPRLPFGLAINHALKMPYLVRARAADFDLIHATSPITALCFPAVREARIVTYWDLVSLLCPNTSSAFHTKLFAPLFLRIGRLADAIIAASSQTKEEMITHLGIPDHRIRVINPGISEMFRPCRPQGRHGFVIGYVGALNRRKGIGYLLRALDRLKKAEPGFGVKVAICGGRDPEYPALRALAVNLKVDRQVEFKGFVGGEALVRAYNSFDVFVLPSEWEGFGFPILEAQRCGVPVIVRKDAHIPQEVSSCCLKASSEEDLADKIFQLLTEDELRHGIIEQGLEYSRRFTWQRTVQETLQVYEAALA
jgi:glycosyltransferase involved in cell wall biosynthesis